ncbi:MAG: hypothetical protein WBO46_06295, partial [Caldilineaceae bacterium]
AEQRDRQGKAPSFADIEVPAELLGDYEDMDDVDEEEELGGGKRGKGKSKAKTQSKRSTQRPAKRPKRPASFDDDESDYSFG